MNTKDTIRIVLNGGADERIVDLGRGQCVSAYAAGDKLKYSVHSIGGDGQAAKELTSLRLKLESERTSSRKKIEKLTQDLAAAVAENEQLKRELAAVLAQKAEADKLLLSIGQSDYVSRLIAERSTEHSKARTEIEARCFAPQCRVWRIKRELKKFVTSMGSEWEKLDWSIAWKIFDDLRWWTGNQKEFADWVAELGYDMGTFSDAKRRCTDRYGKDRFAQWYAQAYGTDHFAVVARGLTAIFVGSPTKPTNLGEYEEGYMDHAALLRAIGRANAGTQGTCAHILIDIPRHADYVRRKLNRYDIYIKDRKHSKDSRHRVHRSKGCFIMAVARHKIMCTI